ncbi:hypothetical protein BKK51_08645 [Rodentibacter trehalosifermentans]|uniref:Uncharacterized protein n=1 Tax=Rodentibacter trehalosifermentans TaxID=1908263 RepID=A0A1V3IQT1_9PAST|nr:Fe-S-containing protein [Rodentibacter trehalosifermentans]OOF44543.1 hypothetical protein BKK51_08645 [Rodentibacter trehalosifermentans]
MTYFFIFLLQALLPISILLGAAWAIKPGIPPLKTIIWISLFGLISGVILRFVLPHSQLANLILTLIFLSVFALFALFSLGQWTTSTLLTQCWQFILMLIAGVTWAKDPNITALTNTDIINTDFILNLSAVIFGVMLSLAVSIWLNFLLKQQQKTAGKSTALFALTALLWLVLVIPLVGELLLILMKLQLIELTKLRLSFVAKASAIVTWFNVICLAVMFINLCIFIFQTHLKRTLQAKIEQDPIEKRKKLALVQTSKRLIYWGLFAMMLIATAQVYWEQVASRPPQLSEAIPVSLNQAQQVHIPIEQVKDGKLHRFVWIADDGKAVRFFIINRQPAKLSLAVVFDACLLCGDQGYVMQGNQVVCVGCGVHMFIPSIGKPGGCNPVPIEDWQQTENTLVINRASLEEGLNLFSTIMEIDVQDPISGKTFKNTQTGYKYSVENRTYFFENEENLEQFRNDPEKYLNRGNEKEE